MSKPGDQWSAAFAGATLHGMQVYDRLIATMFMPFAHDLVDRLAPHEGAAALDVAAGPGTVAHMLAARVGAGGRVVATDISPAMLEIGRAKPVQPGSAAIEWVESPAAPLSVPSNAFEVIACQQGLQFFPDKVGALAEIRRALGDGGRAGVTFWTRVEDQPFFAALRDSIAEVVSEDLAARYNGPWSLTGEQGARQAEAAGFGDVRLERVTLPAVLEGGPEALVETLAASGIAADIAQVDDGARAALLEHVARRVEPLLQGTTLRATLTTSLLTLA